MSRVGVYGSLVVSLLVGCKNPDVPQGGLKREEPSQGSVHGVRFVSLFARDATNYSPLLVVLHGRGDHAESFVRLWHDFPATIEIEAAVAPIPYADGREWFDLHAGMTDHEIATAIGDAEAKLWPAIAELAHGRPLMVAGFSQGAFLTYVMAARHPDAITYAFPISGYLPDELMPHTGSRSAPIYALHGTSDNVVPIDGGRATIAAFTAAGGSAELHEFAGVAHTISPAMRDDLAKHVLAVLEHKPSARSTPYVMEPLPSPTAQAELPVILQTEASDCGVAALAMTLNYYGHRTSEDAVKMAMAFHGNPAGVSALDLVKLAQANGLGALGITGEPDEVLGVLRRGDILHVDWDHFVVVDRAAPDALQIVDPATGKRTLDHAGFVAHFSGTALLFAASPADLLERPWKPGSAPAAQRR